MNTVAADTGGISPSAKSRIILLFTGESGKQYGYLYDGFREDGTFWYTGEGRHGDMRMTKGNFAIRDSAGNGKQLHLFDQIRKAFVQYLGEFAYLDHHEERVPDLTGDLRTAIVFELEAISNEADFETVLLPAAGESDIGRFWNFSLRHLRDLACSISSKEQTPTQRKRTVFERSEAVRIYVLRRANSLKFEYQWLCEKPGYRTSGLSCMSSSPVPLSIGQRRDPFDR
jgi:5-methylcytosine-specific restriction enzyme A